MLSSHSRVTTLVVDSAAAKLVRDAENINEHPSLYRQGLMQNIQSLQAHITSLPEDIWGITGCQEQVTVDVRMAMEEIGIRIRELLTGICTSLKREPNGYFGSDERKEQQVLEEKNSTQPREKNALAFLRNVFRTENRHNRMRDFGPDSPEIESSDRREALRLMTQIESTVIGPYCEAEAQFRSELEKTVSEIGVGSRGTVPYITENIADRANTRLEDEDFIVKVNFPAVSRLQIRFAVKTNLNALMEERAEIVTRRRRQSGLWRKICGTFDASDWGWETCKKDVSHSIINISTVRKEVMSLTRTHFGELQASTEQDINQPARQKIDAFFCALREKVEQLRNTLIRSSKNHKHGQQAQERLTRRLQVLNGRIPKLITNGKVLGEKLETVL